MMIVRIYQVEKQEYMVMDGTTGFMPGAAAIRLLAHRCFGVGADRVLVFTGSEEIPSFKAFTADGEEQEMQESDYAALAKVKEDFEVHLTDSFVQRMRQADRAKMAAAC
ncbi:diaminopimelate epimerase [Mitsuokella jalaludinii]|uniref:diaminopimelate epimerase n=1 Tax=Mitsuokella jalaludinii TaxID=187979 RepID=UPI003F8B7917